MNTALRPEPLRLGVALPLSLGGHAALLVALVALGGRASSEPLIDLDDVVEVSLVALPKQTTALPQKATRLPDPPAPEEALPEAAPPETPPPETPTPPPDPDRMSLADPEAPEDPPPEAAPDAASARRQALAEMEREAARQAALAGLREAPVGDANRSATSPDGVDSAHGTARTGKGDPVMGAYLEKVKGAVYPHFHPVQKEAGLTVIVDVTVNDQGTIIDFGVHTSSKNPSYDRAAMRAVSLAGSVPPPPADRLEDGKLRLALEFNNAESG